MGSNQKERLSAKSAWEAHLVLSQKTHMSGLKPAGNFRLKAELRHQALPRLSSPGPRAHIRRSHV